MNLDCKGPSRVSQTELEEEAECRLKEESVVGTLRSCGARRVGGVGTSLLLVSLLLQRPDHSRVSE